jgi:signal peptidase
MSRVATIGALALALTAVAWSTVAPASFGGVSGFAVLVGSSMEPALAAGDLAVVHKAGDYAVGDVVLYRSDRLQRHVLHRIVRRHGDRYLLRGDANSFADPDEPTRSEIVGRYWFTIPAAGALVEWLRIPLHAAVLVFFAVLAAFLPMPGRRPRTLE